MFHFFAVKLNVVMLSVVLMSVVMLCVASVWGRSTEQYLVSIGSTMVEHSPRQLQLEGSNPTTADVTGGQCYKTFYVRSIRIFVVSVCPWQAFQAFQAWPNKHSSLIWKFVNYGSKKLNNFRPGRENGELKCSIYWKKSFKSKSRMFDG